MLLLATCLVVLQFIATTACFENPRSVHVALETALTFNNKDNSANVKILDDIQNFLSKVRKTVSNKDKPSRRSLREHKPPEGDQIVSAPSYISNIKFTNFIKELIDILKNYKNDDLEDAFAVIDDEIRKYHYKGCKFYELVSENNMRRLIADKLDIVKEKPAKEIRKKLDNTLQLIEDAKFDPKKSELLDYIDSLYTRNDERTFQKILGYFHIYQSKSKRANMDLISLVRDSIRNLIFDHYSNLNVNTRRDFKARLETYFWRNVRENDNVQNLEWTIQYNQVTKKEPLYLREMQLTPWKEKDKELVSNKRDENKPTNTVNLNFEMDNQMDIFQSGRIILGNKKNNTQVESENISVNSNYKPEIDREGHDFDVENTEHIESNSREESGTASNEYDISDKDLKIGHTVNRYEDEGSRNGADVYSAEEFNTKSKRYKKIKHTTPLSMSAHSSEVEGHEEIKGFTNGYIDRLNHKQAKVKGFTNGNIGRSGNKKQIIDMPDLVNHPNSLTPKQKNNRYKMETTLDSRNRMRTLWVESRITKKHHTNTYDEEEANIPDNYPSDVVKATEMPGDLSPQLHGKKDKTRDLKPKKTNKYRPNTRDDIEETKILRTGYEVNDKNKNENTKKDFSLNAYLENIDPDESQGLKFILAATKNNNYDKKSIRNKIKTDDEKPKKSKDDVSSSEPKMKKSLHTTIKRSKLSDASMDEEVSTEFTKGHKSFKKHTRIPISRNKQHKTDEYPTEDETYIELTSQEDNTTKIPKINKKSPNILPTTNAVEQSSVKKSKEKDFSAEEKKHSTTKRTRRPKKAEQSFKKQISTTHKSMEKDIEEEDHGSSDEGIQTATKMTKKDKKHHKKTKLTTPKYTETIEKSAEETKKFAEKEITKKKQKRRENSSKHHIHKTKDKNVTKSLEEEHTESLEKETLKKKLISNEKSKEERKPFPKHKKTIQKYLKDIFISVENKAHQTIKRLKTAAESKNKVASQSFSEEFISVANKAYQPIAAESKKKEASKSFSKESTRSTSEEEKYEGQENINNNTNKFIINSKPEESASQEKLDETLNTELPTYMPTPKQQIIETSTEEPNPTVEAVGSSTTRRTYKAIDIPVNADITEILSNKLLSQASPENVIKSSNENINTKGNIQSNFRRVNSEEHFTNTTRSYLQLIDLLENYTTMTINLNNISETPAVDIKGINQTNSIYPHPDFWKRSGNKVKIKTSDAIDTTASHSTSTTYSEITAKNIITTRSMEQYKDEGLQKARKKKKKRKRMFTKTPATIEPTTTVPITTFPTTTVLTTTVPTTTISTTTTVKTSLVTTTEATPNEITTIKTPDYRRTNEYTDVSDPTIEVETATTNIKPEHGKDKFEYYDFENNTADYDKTTISEIGDDIKEFLDEHDIKLDATNDTDVNIEDINALVGPNIGKENKKPDIKVELRDEKAHIRVNSDMMKLFGKTYSHITVSTTPWNTLYTDPFEDMSLLGMNII